MKCKIRGCSSSTLLKSTFHTIPSVKKDPHRHAIWKRFIDLEVRNGITEKCFEIYTIVMCNCSFQGDLHERAAVCELHFLPSDYLSTTTEDPLSTARKRLRKNAVPSVNPPKDSNQRAFHDNPITPKITQPMHCLVKIEDRPHQICQLCHRNTLFRCEANVCKLPLCVFPCFQSHHENFKQRGYINVVVE